MGRAAIGLGAAVLLAYLGQQPFARSGCRGGDGVQLATTQGAFSASSTTARPNAAKPDCSSPKVAAEGSHRRAVSDDGRIILNLATVDDLVRLPGIGRKRAEAIVALRQRLGKFRRLRDLLRIRGIAYRSLRRLKPHVLLDRPRQERVGEGGANSG